MDAYEVLLEPAAQRDLKRIQGKKLDALQKAIEELAENPRGPKTEKLKTSDPLYRNDSVKSHRIIFEIDDKKKTVLVRRVRDRKDAYKK